MSQVDLALPALPPLKMPTLALPFAACAPHRAVHEIDQATVQWLLDFELVRDGSHEKYLRAIGLGRWFPSLLPSGETEKVLLGSQLTAWFTMLDDQIAEKQGRKAPSVLMRHLVHSEDIARLADRDRSDAVEPIERALQDLVLRLRQVASPEQFLRVQWCALQYYLGIGAETVYTAEDGMPGLDDYRRIRRLNSCIPPFFVMSELARGHRLPLGPLMRPDVQKLTALAVDLVAVVNDIIGLPRDLQRGDSWVLTRVLAHHQGTSVQQGLDRMVQQFHSDVASFVALADRLRVSDPDTMPAYITILEELVAGHLAWTLSSPRYKISGWH